MISVVYVGPVAGTVLATIASTRVAAVGTVRCGQVVGQVASQIRRTRTITAFIQI